MSDPRCTEKTVQLKELYFGPQNQKILLSDQCYAMVHRTIRVQVRQLYKFIDMTIPCIAIVNKIFFTLLSHFEVRVACMRSNVQVAREISIVVSPIPHGSRHYIPIQVEQLYCFFRVEKSDSCQYLQTAQYRTSCK